MTEQSKQPGTIFPLADLTKAVEHLRRPFALEAIRFKPLTKPHNGKSAAAFYIDARLVAERLNAVVGAGGWSDAYTLLVEQANAIAPMGVPVECRLTVLGVTKADVGQLEPRDKVDDKAWKSAYSDALKRAAVKFGIGAYLYALGRWRAPVEVKDGKARGFTDEGREQLLGGYGRWLEDPANTFGEPFDHGDVDPAGGWAPFADGGEADDVRFGDEPDEAGGYG